MEQISFGLFVPLIVLGVAFALVYIASGVTRSRGEEDSAEGLLDIGFALALAAVAWVAILLVISLVSVPDVIYDMVVILLVIGVFFALLLGILFALFELIASRGRRGSSP